MKAKPVLEADAHHRCRYTARVESRTGLSEVMLSHMKTIGTPVFSFRQNGLESAAALYRALRGIQR